LSGYLTTESDPVFSAWVSNSGSNFQGTSAKATAAASLVSGASTIGFVPASGGYPDLWVSNTGIEVSGASFLGNLNGNADTATAVGNLSAVGNAIEITATSSSPGTANVLLSIHSDDSLATSFNIGNTSPSGNEWYFSVLGTNGSPGDGGFQFYNSTTAVTPMILYPDGSIGTAGYIKMPGIPTTDQADGVTLWCDPVTSIIKLSSPSP
jgi:hypothetical protein